MATRSGGAAAGAAAAAAAAATAPSSSSLATAGGLNGTIAQNLSPRVEAAIKKVRRGW